MYMYIYCRVLFFTDIHCAVMYIHMYIHCKSYTVYVALYLKVCSYTCVYNYLSPYSVLSTSVCSLL